MTARYVYRQGNVTAVFSNIHHPRGVEGMLCAGYMEKYLRGRAQAAMGRAIAMAPEDTSRYKTSFEVSAGVGFSTKGHRRAYGRLTNNTTHALYIEWGNNFIAPFRVLRRAVGQADFSRDRYTRKGTYGRRARSR